MKESNREVSDTKIICEGRSFWAPLSLGLISLPRDSLFLSLSVSLYVRYRIALALPCLFSTLLRASSVAMQACQERETSMRSKASGASYYPLWPSRRLPRPGSQQVTRIILCFHEGTEDWLQSDIGLNASVNLKCQSARSTGVNCSWYLSRTRWTESTLKYRGVVRVACRVISSICPGANGRFD